MTIGAVMYTKAPANKRAKTDHNKKRLFESCDKCEMTTNETGETTTDREIDLLMMRECLRKLP